jgi:hypothetical protein
LQVTTSYGCTNAVTKQFALTVPIILGDQGYFENFESGTSAWNSGTSGTDTTNSWTLGSSTPGFPRGKSGSTWWYTRITRMIAPEENSWVKSPCFDFTGTRKPMLKMDIWRKFNSLRDGAVIQFSADSGKIWKNIGQLNDGVNWFNEYLILGKPGDQAVGWSNTQDTGWIETRHALDMLKDKPRVQFRIAYGSDGTALNSNGMAFDNFWIGDRNRIALLEHFTNASDAKSKEEDDNINNLVQSDSLNMIDLQYHASFPGPDPFNAQEPYTPGARLLYYGLSTVPYTILNGGYKPDCWFDYNTRSLDPDTVRHESLLDSKFNINLHLELRSNTLDISTQVTATENLPQGEYTVHVGVIERKITGLSGNNGETEFENVVKILLPDPAGTTFYKSWTSEEIQTIDNNWDLKNVYDRDQIRAFAFIQNEATSEVYQTALKSIDLVTGTHDLLQTTPGNKFVVYPYPAANSVFLRFDKSVTGMVTINIYNNQGSLVYADYHSVTGNETEINTSDFPDGIYMIRVLSGHSVIGIRKLNITR